MRAHKDSKIVDQLGEKGNDPAMEDYLQSHLNEFQFSDREEHTKEFRKQRKPEKGRKTQIKDASCRNNHKYGKR